MPQRFRVGPGWSSSCQSPLGNPAHATRSGFNRSRQLGLVGLEAGPPMSVLEQHKLPSVASGESPYSHTLDPRWAEVSLSHLRD